MNRMRWIDRYEDLWGRKNSTFKLVKLEKCMNQFLLVLLQLWINNRLYYLALV